MSIVFQKILRSWAVVLVCVFAFAGCKRESPSLDPAVLQFANLKEAQARDIVQQQSLEMPPAGWKLFEAVRADNFRSASNLFAPFDLIHTAAPRTNLIQQGVDLVKSELEKRGFYTPGPSAIESPAWHALLDTYWAYALSKHWNEKFLDLYADEILGVVPKNSIFFAGSDPSRFTISAKSGSRGHPLYVISQTQLADFSYLAYVSLMFTNQFALPNADSFQTAWQSYTVDLLKLKQRVAVMRMNGVLAKEIFDKNPGYEFYLQPYSISDWTYRHLIPCGPILKINREPLAALPEHAVESDRKYWTQLCARLIGDWINESTTVTEVCDYVEKVYLRGDATRFKGDPDYLADNWAQDGFTELRFAMADLYLWRCIEASQVVEKQKMLNECLLAFEQTLALGPRNSKVPYYFAYMLSQVNRDAEAIRVLEIGMALQPTDLDLKTKLEEIKAKAKKTTSN